MAVSEKKKASNAKWDKENIRTVACRLKKDDAEAFKEYAEKQGKTVNTLIREYVLQCIAKD